MSIKNNPLSDSSDSVSSDDPWVMKEKMPKSITFIYDSFASGLIIFGQILAVLLVILIPCATLIGFMEGYYWMGSIGLILCIFGVGVIRNSDD